MTAKYTVLGNTTLATASSSVTFSSIPGGYKDLVLTTENDGSYFIRVNNDSSSTYANVRMVGDGTSASSSTFDISFWSPTNAGTAGLGIWQIMDYSATDKHKTALSRLNRASGNASAGAHRYPSTSAITSLILDTGGNPDFSIGSTFRLLGVN
tara:strand:- start:524 stop:982 length:459 start_codon:yes stop_codon:yes gene_type:complete